MTPLVSHEARSAAILVGGAARRLGGRPKGLIEIDGLAVVDRVAGALTVSAGPVTLLGDPAGPYAGRGWAVVPDDERGLGPAGGVLTALRRAETGWVFICALDLPFLTPELVLALGEARSPQTLAVFAELNGRLEPMAGWWSTALAPTLADRLAQAKASGKIPGFAALLSGLPVGRVPWMDARPLTNLNEPRDVESAGGAWPQTDGAGRDAGREAGTDVRAPRRA